MEHALALEAEGHHPLWVRRNIDVSLNKGKAADSWKQMRCGKDGGAELASGSRTLRRLSCSGCNASDPRASGTSRRTAFKSGGGPSFILQAHGKEG